MYRILIVGVINAAITLSAVAQYEPNYSIIPSSPNAMSLVKEINIPVNPYSGTADINIPLFNLHEGGITIPIALSYNTSGIKIQDVAGSVGLGWNLSKGGMITRVVKGLPDDDDNGFCGLNTRGNPSLNYTFADNIFKGDWDGEPDIFYYSFPGHSGKFVLNYDRTVVLVPYSNIKIIPFFVNDKFDHFNIIDESGNEFHFLEHETSTSVQSGVTKTFKSTWYLSEIKPVNSSAVVSFTYTYGEGQVNMYYYCRTKHIKPNPDSGVDHTTIYEDKNINLTILDPKYLSTIQTSGEKLEFDYSGRQDLQNGLSINGISLYTSGNSFIKKYKFQYDYFHSPDNLSKRLKLINVQESNINDEQLIPPYEFYYYISENLPTRNSPSFDHWGYYNLNTAEIENYENIDRTPDFYKAKANILEKIILPTGGYKRLEYELNNYGENNTLTGGLRVKKIYQSTGTISDEKLSQEYEYTVQGANYSSGWLFKSPSYYDYRHPYTSYYVVPPIPVLFAVTGEYFSTTSFIDYFDLDGYHIGYDHVKIKLPLNGNVEYYYTGFNDQPDSNPEHFEDNDADHIFTSFGTSGNFNIVTSPRSWRRGLLKSEIVNNENDQMIDSTYYNYDIVNVSNSQFVSGYRSNFYSIYSEPSYSLFRYEYISEFFSLLERKSYHKSGNQIIESVSNLNYNSIGQLANISKSQSDGSVSKITYRYLNDVFTSEFPLMNEIYRAFSIMKSKNMISNPIETITYKDDKVIAAKVQSFKEFPLLSENVHPFITYGLESINPIEPSSYVLSAVNNPYLPIQMDSHLNPKSYCDDYDDKGNLLMYHNVDNINTSYIWGYNQTNPVAKIVNASKQEVETAFGGTIPDLGAGGLNAVQITSLRSGLPKALITTYNYSPLIGILSQTDINGLKSYYEYDSFGRLEYIKDNNGKILKHLEYHYNLPVGN